MEDLERDELGASPNLRQSVQKRLRQLRAGSPSRSRNLALSTPDLSRPVSNTNVVIIIVQDLSPPHFLVHHRTSLSPNIHFILCARKIFFFNVYLFITPVLAVFLKISEGLPKPL